MANPGYPMQPPMGGGGGMGGMGGGGMGGGPMGPGGPNPLMQQPQPPQQMMRPPQPMKRGTPKAVPVLVSAGLAIGVFCGLLFGLGTGDKEANAASAAPEEKKFVGTKIEGTDDTVATSGGLSPAPPKSVTSGELVTGKVKEPKPTAGSAAAGSATAGSAAAGSATGSGAAPVTPPPPAHLSKLTIALKPDTVKDAKITVDGVDVTNNTLEVDLGDKTKKEVVVVVKAPGFKDLEQKLEVDEGEMKVEYQLVKARTSSGGTSSTPKRPPPPGGTGKKPPKKPGGGGLIDI